MAILSKDRQEEIDAAVERVREDTGMSYPHNNLLDIAEKLGVKVYDVDLSEYEIGSNAKGVNGIIDWDKNEAGQDIAEIYLNKDFSSARKIFTLAHELGHYMLHSKDRKLRVDVFDYSKDTQESIEETEANYFAASLLMPKEEFERVLRVANGNIDITSKYFGVSSSAAENRLQWIQKN